MIKIKLLYLLVILYFPFSVVGQETNLFDTHGERHGVWKKYYEGTTQLRYEGIFEHGKEIGEFRFYKRSNKKQPTAIKVFSSDTDSVKVTYFSSAGRVISKGVMIGKTREGKWLYFHKDSDKTMTEEYYIKDVLQGEKNVYFPSGNITEKSNYVDGKKQGKSTVYSEKGVVVKEFNYDNDELHGRVSYYDGKGTLTIEGNYKRDRKDGVWKYYENGKLKEEKIFPIKKPK